MPDVTPVVLLKGAKMLNQNVAAYVAQYNLSSFIGQELLSQLAVRQYSRGETVIALGEPVVSLALLVEGRVKVVLPTAHGRRLLLCYYTPLQLLGDAELFEVEPVATTSVEAIHPCVCLEVRREAVLSTLTADPAFLRQICLGLGRKLRRAVRNSTVNLLYPLEQRVASYLAATAAPNAAGTPSVVVNVTQVAELLGTSFRHLHRTLSLLCAQGVVRKDREAYLVLQPEELRRRAGDAYIIT